MELINDIKNYISFLKEKHNIDVCIHEHNSAYKRYSHIISLYNSHITSFCACVKSSDHSKCVEGKQKVVARCSNGPFYGKCRMGAEEFVFPTYCNEKITGFISVYGYRGKFAPPVLSEPLKSYYLALNPAPPTIDELSPLVKPLCAMLELLAIKAQSFSNNDESMDGNEIYESIVNYLSEHFTEKISLVDLSKNCQYSVSYLRHVFKETTGLSVGKYLLDLRINKSKNLLKYTSMRITEIAIASGFDDPVYFAKIFKRETGVTPTVYRKRER